MNLGNLDKNMAVESKVSHEGLKFYSADEKPLRRYGLIREGDSYCRIPTEIAESVSEGVKAMNCFTAGGRVRFVTSSRRIAIIAKYSAASLPVHIPYSGKAGLDIYIGNRYEGTYLPPLQELSFESEKTFDGSEKLVTLNLPPYIALSELYIGIDEDAEMTEAPDYKYEVPVVYYGSSITQGGCASRPGMTYQAILSRRLDCNFTNLGFSGSAKAEKAIVDYMAGLDMSVFVCDYDYNAHSQAHLAATHEPLYRAIRAAHPKTPIIFITRPQAKGCDEQNRSIRVGIIKETYDKAVAEGDENVWFLDASEFFPFESNEHTVDGVHPTDLGFYLMANGIEPALREALAKVKI